MSLRYGAAILALLAVLLPLSIHAATSNSLLPGEVALARFLQGTPGGDTLEKLSAWTHALRYPALVAGAAVALHYRRYNLVAVALIVVIALAANPILKDIIERSRPSGELLVLREHAGGFGFPSGHVQSTTMLFGYLAAVSIISQRGRIAAVVATIAASAILFVAWERVYDGAHWPSDALGGVIFGLLLLLAAFALVRFAASIRAVTGATRRSLLFGLSSR